MAKDDLSNSARERAVATLDLFFDGGCCRAQGAFAVARLREFAQRGLQALESVLRQFVVFELLELFQKVRKESNALDAAAFEPDILLGLLQSIQEIEIEVSILRDPLQLGNAASNAKKFLRHTDGGRDKCASTQAEGRCGWRQQIAQIRAKVDALLAELHELLGELLSVAI